MTIIILAAGFSSRMGKNKLLLPLNGKPLILTSINNALSFTDKVLVVVGHEKDKLIQVLPKTISYVFNEHYEEGQNTSILKGIEEVEDDVMLVPGDLPFITQADYLAIKEALKSNMCARAFYQDLPAHPVGIRKDLLELIKKERPKSMKSFLASVNIRRVLRGENTVLDIDTPQDYELISSH